jgi:endonuclease YncB( thermonuclease family)
MKQLIKEMAIGALAGAAFGAALLITIYSIGDAFSATPVVYSCELDHVIDGDTIKVRCPTWPEPFKETSLRVYGLGRNANF